MYLKNKGKWGAGWGCGCGEESMTKEEKMDMLAEKEKMLQEKIDYIRKIREKLKSEKSAKT